MCRPAQPMQPRGRLRLFEKTLANVAPDLRRHYVADEEHGYRLDLIDLDDFVGGLKRALAAERETNKEIKANGGTLAGPVARSPFGGTLDTANTQPPPAVRGGTVP